MAALQRFIKPVAWSSFLSEPMKKVSEVQFESLADQLEEAGLNLCAPFSLSDLADSMPDLDILLRSDQRQPDRTQNDLAPIRLTRLKNILLIGSAGKKLWQSMPQEYLQRDDPVDEYSVDCINRVLKVYLPEGSWQFLFPEAPQGLEISLQKLGSMAGWHHASPLGIGINDQYGLWFAYRAVVAIESELDRSDLDGAEQVDQDKVDYLSGESPCLSCEAKPCLSSCPALALSSDSNPDLTACVSHRVAPASDCASTCLARQACPIAPQFKYSDDQVTYFYGRSLTSAMRWVAHEKN